MQCNSRTKLVALAEQNLSTDEKKRIQAAVDAIYQNRGMDDARHAYCVKGGIDIEITQIDGRKVIHKVDAVSLSKYGMAILHSQFVYTNSPCALSLISLEGKKSLVDGEIVRCDCVAAPIHVIGIQFSQPIEVNAFVGVANSGGAGSSSSSSDGVSHSGSVDSNALQQGLGKLSGLIHEGADSATLQAALDGLCEELHVQLAYPDYGSSASADQDQLELGLEAPAENPEPVGN